MGLHKKVVPMHPSKVDETIDVSKGTLVACKDKTDLLDSWLARPLNFSLGNKQ